MPSGSPSKRSKLISSFSDAPFGRFLSNDKSIWTVNGRVGWLLMEIVSPLSFLYFLSTPATLSSFTFPTPSLARFTSTLQALSPARIILVVFYVVHYANRSIVGELRNPGRSRMHIVIPLLSAVWNLANGGTNGFWMGGGGSGDNSSYYGLKNGSTSPLLFAVGAVLWLGGFASNIYHDNVLFAIKRQKRADSKQLEKKGKPTPSDPKDRYAIPQGGLYSYISHPSYTSEWVEWTGFSLCTLALSPATFPSSPIYAKLPPLLRPLKAWYLQPASLFVIQEVAAMLPRAISGHAWYSKTFGKEWEKTGAKWIVLPGLY